MVFLQLLAICYLHGISFGEETCSLSLPASDPRSCENEVHQKETGHRVKLYQFDDDLSQADSHLDTEDISISERDYMQAKEDAENQKFESSIPFLRRAAKILKKEAPYIDLCAFLINYGHTRPVMEAVALYDEAEINCNVALALNPKGKKANEKLDDINANFDALRNSRKMRGILVEPKVRPGIFRGVKKQNAEVKNESENNEQSGMSSYAERSALVDSIRINPRPRDDGDLEFHMYNGSRVDPSNVMLQLGEVYVEDDFISTEERLRLIKVVEKGLPYVDKTGDKGPAGAVLSGTISSLISQLSNEERNLIARVRERVINRANDLKNLDTSMYDTLKGVRAHSTAFIRYIQTGKHEIHHDNDFLNRCLSSSIVLNDDFEGGEFNLHTTKDEDKWNLEGFPIIGTVKGKPGRLSLFLSQTMHSVSEIVSGTRDVFFVWCTCDIDAEYQLDEPLESVDDRKIWMART